MQEGLQQQISKLIKNFCYYLRRASLELAVVGRETCGVELVVRGVVLLAMLVERTSSMMLEDTVMSTLLEVGTMTLLLVVIVVVDVLMTVELLYSTGEV